MDPISASILGGVGLFSTLGQALFGQAQAERKAVQGALAEQTKAQQQAFGEHAEKAGGSLAQLIEAYRSGLAV